MASVWKFPVHYTLILAVQGPSCPFLENENPKYDNNLIYMYMPEWTDYENIAMQLRTNEIKATTMMAMKWNLFKKISKQDACL